MEWVNGMKEMREAEKTDFNEELKFDKKTLEKYDKIFGDDTLDVRNDPGIDMSKPLSPSEREKKYNALFDVGDIFNNSCKMPEMNGPEFAVQEANSEQSGEPDFSKKRESDVEYEPEGDCYEIDDNGVPYKKNGELLPNVEYSKNGHIYRTDEKGRIKSCDGKPEYTDEGNRNTKEQKESGGDERQEDDDGGHIIAKILNGSEGAENLVPMRRTINRGDYKKMENEIAKAIQEGKKVTMHIDLHYDGDSQRPSKIRVEYTIDGKKTVVEFDNKESSTELLDSLENKISDKDYQDLKDEINDMQEDGNETSITSVKTEYDDNGNPVRITVGILDESTGRKTYKVYESAQEA